MFHLWVGGVRDHNTMKGADNGNREEGGNGKTQVWGDCFGRRGRLSGVDKHMGQMRHGRMGKRQKKVAEGDRLFSDMPPDDSYAGLMLLSPAR